MENSSTDYSSLEPTHMHWLLAAFLSLVCLGVGGYIVGSYSMNPFAVKAMCSLAFVTYGILSSVYYCFKFFRAHKRFPKLSDSTVVSNSEIAPGVLLAFFGGMLTGVGQLSLILGYHFDPEGRGVVTILNNASILLTVIFAYLIFKEHTGIPNLIGMILCTAGMVVITLQSSTDGTWKGILGGMGAMAAFCVRNLMARQMDLSGLDYKTAGIMNAFGEAAFGAVFIVVLMVCFANPFLNEQSFLMPYLGGLIISVGAFLVNQGIMTGYVGPVITIASLAGILQMWLDFAIESIVPNAVKSIGSVIVLFGVSFIVMGEQIFRAIGLERCTGKLHKPTKKN